jgi:hypothetical protein
LPAALEGRSHEPISEKNCTLIRCHILKSLRDVWDGTGEAAARDTAVRLVAAEEELKYRQKYAALWRTK